MVDVTLPKKVKGEELVEIIKESLISSGYSASITPLDGHYEPGSVKSKETKKGVYGHKTERKPLSVADKVFFNIPVMGWIFYLLEKRNPDSIFFFNQKSMGVTLEPDSEYDSINLDIGGITNADELKKHPSLKEEFEKLEKNIYARLGYQSSPAANS